MKSKFLFIVGGLLILLALLPLMRSRPSSLPWLSNADEAFQEAEQNNQQVLAYLYTDWCTYCRQMEQTTFKDPAVIGALADQYVWLKLNAETDPAGMKLQRQFGVTGYPTILVLDSRGSEVDRLQGFMPSDRFMDSLSGSSNLSQSYSSLMN